LALATAVWHQWPRPSTSATAQPGKSAPSTAPLPAADPTRIDPCELARPAQAQLGLFGQPHVDAHVGNFDRCDVYIDPPNNSPELDIEFQLQLPNSSVSGPIRTDGLVNVEQNPFSDQECDSVVSRTSTHASAYAIAIGTKYTHGDGSGYDLCQLAEAAANADVTVLNSGRPLALRKDPPKSLANLNACNLLDASALTRIGAFVTSAASDFGNWGCAWDSAGDLSVKLRFDQGTFTPYGGHQTKIQSYPVSIEPDGDGGGPNCLVAIRYHLIAGTDQKYEMVDVIVDGSGSSTALCTPAKQLAEEAATHLPR